MFDMLRFMDWLNYHHLLYFWLVVREGGVVPAAAKLRLAHPTVSGQVHALEDALGEKLFVRQGRRLVLTEMGRVVHGYADEIFSLGGELLDAVRGRATGRPVRLVVGIADVLPKLIVRQILEPALHLGEPVQLVCREAKPDRLLADLALHELDLVLSDAPVGPNIRVRAYSHLLGECGLTFLATRELARRHKRRFPASLDGAPMLLPTSNTALRRSLDTWFEAKEIRPRVVAELEDSALIQAFGQDGVGVFAVPTAIEAVVRRQSEVVVVGRTTEVLERFYAISVERKLKHPAVVAICQTARSTLFG
jgi:LysR family transcriptional activator of nhaA